MNRSVRWWACVAVCWCLGAGSVLADVKLPKIFGDNMVIQQNRRANFWGWADKGDTVTIDFAGNKTKAQAGDDGRWSATLEPPKAGGPYEITVACPHNAITLKNVLVGEVWVCSGQSNMEWPMTRSQNPEADIKAADHPSIRLFTVKRTVSFTPKDDLDATNGGWSQCTPQSAAGFSAVAYFFGRKLQAELDVPVGLINSSWGGTRAEAWTSAEGLAGVESLKPLVDFWAAKGEADPGTPHRNCVLYNAMIRPLIPLSIRGAIWYQGESNVGRAQQYATLFPTMIGDWRRAWNLPATSDAGAKNIAIKEGEAFPFPFAFVQLAPYRYGGNPEALAELWEAQTKTLAASPNTGMAVTTDITDIKDIHPKNKHDVGGRLALWALANTYGKDVVFSGPMYKSHRIEDNKIRLEFNHLGGGLAIRSGDALTHFTIAGEDQKFAPAKAEIAGDAVIVSSEAVAKPVAVRFAWHQEAEPNFVNKAGLPASPFRTDNFKMATDGKTAP